jgi:hypothetical protein
MPSQERLVRPRAIGPHRPSPWAACALLTLTACVGAGQTDGFFESAATAPEDTPARLTLSLDRIETAAAGITPGSVPPAVRATIEAVTPGGELVFLGREWGRNGEGFRVESRYVDGAAESFRSALINEEGEILERSHTLPATKVPPAVLGAAMKLGRDIRRCEIVSDAVAEREWRIRCVDGGGRTFVATVSLDGRLLHAQRIVTAELQVDAR